MESKLRALQEKQLEQDKTLAESELGYLKEEELQKRVFDNQAYLALSINNFSFTLRLPFGVDQNLC